MSSTYRPVRVRFAPSPTGYLHVGGIRSALFNWLWARHSGGRFVLRVEDTDRNRLVPEAFDQINDSLEALGIAPDEGPKQGGKHGPYTQSERLGLYSEHATTLVASGALYPCWCTPARLTDLREAAQAKGQAFKYDRHCLAHPGDLTQPHVLRFRIPETPESIAWDDAVRGPLEFKLTDLDDFVAIKADGFPTYQFANVVDDHLMEISHVMRADEWIPSTPKHLLLFAALGWQPPVYAHLPAVQGPTGGKKLSKRDGAMSVQEYIAQGYLPGALRSYLATLGWNDGTTDEIYDTATLIERFTLDRIQKSPARFDLERLTYVNGYLIRNMPVEKLLKHAVPFWPTVAKSFSDDYWLSVLKLVQDRIKFLAELPELTEFFFVDPEPSPELLTKALTAPVATNALKHATSALKDVKWTEEALEAAIRPLAEELDLKTGQLFGLLRISLTGRTAAPGLFETMEVLGRDTVIRRLEQATDILRN